MSEDADADELAGLLQTLGDGTILGGRLRVSRRMVVNENQGGGVREDRRLEDLPRTHERSGERADRHLIESRMRFFPSKRTTRNSSRSRHSSRSPNTS
jgi:hypothetical protein